MSETTYDGLHEVAEAMQSDPMIPMIEAINYIRSSLDGLGTSGYDTVPDGLIKVAEAIEHLARAVEYLGNGNAATQMGAIEAFGLVMKEGFDQLSSALHESAR